MAHTHLTPILDEDLLSDNDVSPLFSIGEDPTDILDDACTSFRAGRAVAGNTAAIAALLEFLNEF